MIKTRLTELVGIKYPVIQAGMGPFPVTSLCIAAANAGCLGLCSTFGTLSRTSNPVVFGTSSSRPTPAQTMTTLPSSRRCLPVSWRKQERAAEYSAPT